MGFGSSSRELPCVSVEMILNKHKTVRDFGQDFYCHIPRGCGCAEQTKTNETRRLAWMTAIVVSTLSQD